VPTSKPQPDRTLVKALARAHRWQRVLEEGRFGTLAEMADAERISRSYVSRILRLTLLAPDIVERILDGRQTAGLAQS
jgi:ParB-like chromosome segregation protein Spo0J